VTPALLGREMPQITIQNGSRAGQVFTLASRTVLGRSRAADLALDDPSISRRHAQFEPRDRTCSVADLGSANGTFVNGRPVSKPTTLHDGDLIAFGTVLARYRSGAPVHTAPGVRYSERPLPDRAAIAAVPASGAADQALGQLRAEEILQVATRRFEFLAALGRQGNAIFDEQRLLAFVLEELFGVLPQAERAVVVVRDNGDLVPRCARTRDGLLEEIEVSRTIIADAVARRETILLPDVQLDVRYAPTESIRMLRLRSVVCAPLVSQGDVLGALHVQNGPADPPFSVGDLHLVAGLAAIVSMALAHARLHAQLLEQQLLERDLLLARKVQQHFLPAQLPSLAGYGVAIDYEPAMAVGGDFYDFLELSPGRIAIAVGDVCGKGMSAALYAARLGSELRFQSVGEAEPGRILACVNEALARWSQDGMFATLVLGVLDVDSGRLLVAAAGHPPPLMRAPDGTVREIRVPAAPVLGLQAGRAFEACEDRLAPGSAVVFMTDGVHEALNDRGELFGMQRVSGAVAGADGHATAIRDRLGADLRRFAGAAEQSDDITLVCVSRDRAGAGG
jgi:phosphoserine phosphatase RsbU/P